MHSFLITCSISAFIGCDNHLLWISSPSWIIWTHYFTSCSLREIIQPLHHFNVWLLIIVFFFFLLALMEQTLAGLPVQHSQCMVSAETCLQRRWQKSRGGHMKPILLHLDHHGYLLTTPAATTAAGAHEQNAPLPPRSGTTDAALERVPLAPILGEPRAKQTTLTKNISPCVCNTWDIVCKPTWETRD